MPWFKVDDGYWHDVQMTSLSDGAQALWLRAGTYSAQKMLDGFIPDEALRLLRVRKRYIEELERAAVWRRSAGGWLAVRWQENIRSRSDIEADRDKTKQRVRSHRNAVTPPVTNAAPVPGPVPVPERERETAPPAVDHSEPKPRVIGLRWWSESFNSGGGAPPMFDRAYEVIGSKPPAERALVAEHVSQSKYLRANKTLRNPDHIAKHWDRYVASPGDDPLVKPVRNIEPETAYPYEKVRVPR